MDPRATYEQSLGTLRYAKTYAQKIGHEMYTKSAIMMGLGEQEAEVVEAFDDLRSNDVDVLTMGQYLRPSMTHLPVEKFVTPEEFLSFGKQAEAKGFLYVASGPMVRSSYKAAELFLKGKVSQRRKDAIQTS